MKKLSIVLALLPSIAWADAANPAAADQPLPPAVQASIELLQRRYQDLMMDDNKAEIALRVQLAGLQAQVEKLQAELGKAKAASKP